MNIYVRRPGYEEALNELRRHRIDRYGHYKTVKLSQKTHFKTRHKTASFFVAYTRGEFEEREARGWRKAG